MDFLSINSFNKLNVPLIANYIYNLTEENGEEKRTRNAHVENNMKGWYFIFRVI